MNKTTVIYHSADFDGIFCREIARKFLPDAELIGWDFGKPPLPIPQGQIYVMDLPCDQPFGFRFGPPDATQNVLHSDVLSRFVWIDHHKSSIESHPPELPGYRIDGVAACRLAWQWFSEDSRTNGTKGTKILPMKAHYVERVISEPVAVRLAGEYDIWDKRDPNADTFQFALRAMDSAELPWKLLLSATGSAMLTGLLDNGRLIERYQRRMDEEIATTRTFDVVWKGLRFLAINAVRCNSKTFEAAAKPEHDALLGFYTDGKKWNVSMYHAPHRKEIDLSKIAVEHGGGGHSGACGFQCKQLPFLPAQ